MSCLEEFQAKQEPITLEKMAAIQKEYEEREKNKEALIYECVFQRNLVKYLTAKIGEKGPANEITMTWNYLEDFIYRSWDINGTYYGVNMSDSASKRFREYIKGRLDTIFPDYNVSCEFKRITGFCWTNKKQLSILLVRKDQPAAEVQAKETSEKDVLLT